jgi:putative oxidoreductase
MSYAYPIPRERGSRAGSLPDLRAVIRTEHDWSQTVLRVSLGLILFPHGAQHLLGWFGGFGFAGTLGWMTSVGFPAPLAALAIVTEFVAPIALVLGVGGRIAALGVAFLMAGAVKTHLAAGFFMNWFGQMDAGMEGFEYHLLMIAMAAAVVIRGSGALSLDRILFRGEGRPQR